MKSPQFSDNNSRKISFTFKKLRLAFLGQSVFYENRNYSDLHQFFVKTTFGILPTSLSVVACMS